MQIGFLREPVESGLGDLQYPRAISLAHESFPVAADFKPSIERPKSGDVAGLDRYNCVVFSELIETLKSKVEDVLDRSLKTSEMVQKWVPAVKIENAEQVVEGLLAAAKEMTSLGDLSINLLRACPLLFAEPPPFDGYKGAAYNSIMPYLPTTAKSIIRDFGREVDNAANLIKVFALTISADLNNRQELPESAIFRIQSLSQDVIDSQRALYRFVLTLDGPPGFRTLTAKLNSNADISGPLTNAPQLPHTSPPYFQRLLAAVRSRFGG